MPEFTSKSVYAHPCTCQLYLNLSRSGLLLELPRQTNRVSSAGLNATRVCVHDRAQLSVTVLSPTLPLSLRLKNVGQGALCVCVCACVILLPNEAL